MRGRPASVMPAGRLGVTRQAAACAALACILYAPLRLPSYVCCMDPLELVSQIEIVLLMSSFFQQ